MDTIRISIQAYITDLFPQGSPSRRSGGQRVQALANGLAMPSFWSEAEIRQTFKEVNHIWDQAKIEFAPVQITRRTDTVPADGDSLWAYIVNNMTPRHGIGVAFVFDLPSNEGGWGGGRVAAIAGAKSLNALPGYKASVVAHELGHVLLGATHHNHTEPSSLMYDRRNPRIVSANLLDEAEITTARRRAAAL